MADPRDLRGLVRMAVEAEEAGFDAIMLSEHVVLGRSADADGLMPNPREYALPGNQDPAMPWPSSLVLLSAIAAATTRLRLVHVLHVIHQDADQHSTEAALVQGWVGERRRLLAVR